MKSLTADVYDKNLFKAFRLKNLHLQKFNTLQKSSQSESLELATLRKACQLQKYDLEKMHQQVEEMKHEVQTARYFKSEFI